MKKIKYILIISLLCLAFTAKAKVVLPSFFTDNMVIQQNTILTIPGKTNPGKKVTVKVSWNNNAYTTKADENGNFQIEVPTPEAGGPHTITISDGKALTLSNILSGEVWFCSGQSNMEMPVAGWGKVLNYEKEIAEAQYPSIRLLQVKKKMTYTPQNNIEVNMGGWQECSSATVPEFSSIAYFYARELWKELHIPIGVIDCTWGGTPAEAWTSIGSIEQVMGFQEEAARMRTLNFDKELLNSNYIQESAKWKMLLLNKDRGLLDGKPQWISSLQLNDEWKEMELPGHWEGKGLNGFDGVIWFQKEIEIPVAWAGKEITLNLGMIDDEDITYYNGVEIAKGHGHASLRKYTIPANLIKAGKGIITIRVSDFGGEGGIYGTKETLFAEFNGEQISLLGPWNYRIGVSLTELPTPPVSPESSGYPCVLYNGMVHALTQFPIKGAIWYQGEANVGRDEQYKYLFPTMILDWRKQWNHNFPFYFVQLANYLERADVQPNSQWAALREAQAKALNLENTGMAVSIDIGEAYDIHPKNKQEVARRLAIQALVNTYNKKALANGPGYRGFKVVGNTLIVHFDKNIQPDNDPKGFIIAGPNGIFHPATAAIHGKEITLHAPEVEYPMTARYGWADNPECTLYGENGLPVIPFRTDQ